MDHSRRSFLKTTSTGLLGLGGVASLSGTALAGRYTIYSDLRNDDGGVTAGEIDDAILAVRGQRFW